MDFTVPVYKNHEILCTPCLKENVKTTSALLGLSYRGFIKWKVPSVH